MDVRGTFLPGINGGFWQEHTFLFILSKLSPFTDHIALTPTLCCVRREDVFVRLEVMQETTAIGNTYEKNSIK